MTFRRARYYWATAQKIAADHEGLFTVSEIYALTSGVKRTAVMNFVLALIETGHCRKVAERDDGRGHVHHVYRLVTTQKALPRLSFHNPRQVARQNLWNAMRAVPHFTIRDIARMASTDEIEISEAVARHYLWWLVVARFVVSLRPGRRVRVYRLHPAGNTGPLAPIVMHRERTVLDRNTSRTVNVTELRRAA